MDYNDQCINEKQTPNGKGPRSATKRMLVTQPVRITNFELSASAQSPSYANFMLETKFEGVQHDAVVIRLPLSRGILRRVGNTHVETYMVA